MIKVGILEIACVRVARRTGPAPMVGWCAVTSGTILATNRRVVEISVFEVTRVCMAG